MPCHWRCGFNLLGNRKAQFLLVTPEWFILCWRKGGVFTVPRWNGGLGFWSECLLVLWLVNRLISDTVKT